MVCSGSKMSFPCGSVVEVYAACSRRSQLEGDAF